MRFSFALRCGAASRCVAFGCRLGPMVVGAEAGEVAEVVVVTTLDVVYVGGALLAAYAFIDGGAQPLVSL